MKDYYTLKEIIFGLRSELLHIEEKLRLLESKINIPNNINFNVSRFDFDIENNNALTYHLQQKYSILENIINLLTFRLDRLFKSKDYIENLRKLGNGDYKIGGIGGLIATISQNDQVSFNRIIEDLMKNEYIKNGPFEIMGNKKWRYESNLLLCPTEINYTRLNNDNSNSLFYLPTNDMFTFIHETGTRKSYSEIITELMELRFPKKYFPEYIQYIIDNNYEVKKDIIIPVIKTYNRKVDLYVNDERDAFVLVKKK